MSLGCNVSVRRSKKLGLLIIPRLNIGSIIGRSKLVPVILVNRAELIASGGDDGGQKTGGSHGGN